MRVSVMMHLPALVMTGHTEKAFRAIHDLRLAVRGLYGEGTEAHGEFYQISNQITIGRDEHEIVDDLQAVIEGLVSYELQARARMLDEEMSKLEDRVWRGYATLTHARIISSEEAMKHLSSLRLGIGIGLMPDISIQDLNRIFLNIQPAHLQRMVGRELSSAERDLARADYIREQLG
jgi:protein arginine kinase